MNNARRSRIRRLIQNLKACRKVDDRWVGVDWEFVEGELQDLLEEEQEAMDNIPENLQDGDRYMVAEESVGSLEEAIDAIDPDDYNCAQDIVSILEQIDGI